MAARNWTPEQRQQQAERVKAWRRWPQSTGPRTPEGKTSASRNAWKGGRRGVLRELGRMLETHRQTLKG